MRRHPESPPRLVTGGRADRGQILVANRRDRGRSTRSSSPSRWRSQRFGNRGESSQTELSATASAKLAAAYVDGTLSLEDAARIVAGAPHRKPLAFRDAIAEVANEGFDVFLEVGPHPVLASAIKQCLGSRERSPLILASLRRGDAGLETMRSSAASLYARGFDIEWSRVSPAGRFVRLPGYPWQRERFWLDDEDKPGKDSSRDGQPDQVDANRCTAPHQNGHVERPPCGPGRGTTRSRRESRQPRRSASRDPTERCGGTLGRFLQEGLADLPVVVRRQRLMEYFRDRVAAVLGLAPDKVDPDRPFMSLGLDSLSAMDLKVEIDAGLGTTFPLSMLMEGSGIRELAERVSERLAGTPTGSSRREPSAPCRATVEAGPPLSHGQQMLWYAHQFTTTGAAYHVLGAGLVRADLDIDVFRRAMRRVIARQEALRTTFVLVDEKPAVRLLDVDDLVRREDEWLPIEDVAGCDDAELIRKLAELAHRPFDLEKGPLFRVHILSRVASEHVVPPGLSITSSPTSGPRRCSLTTSRRHTPRSCAGRSGELPPPRSSYANFARWQHEMVAGTRRERHWAVLAAAAFAAAPRARPPDRLRQAGHPELPGRGQALLP